MKNGNIHIATLGAYLEQGKRSDDGSTASATSRSSRSGANENKRTLVEAQANDPWGLFIVPFATSRYGIVLTDGVQNWNVVMEDTESVEDALHSFLTKYYKYALLPAQNENGTYHNETSQHRGGPTGSYSNRRYSTLNGFFDNLVNSAKHLFDMDDDDFDVEYELTNYRLNSDTADYNTAMNQGLLRTLTEIMVSSDALSKTFYLPYGYYYIGKDVDTSPYYDIDTATNAKITGDRATQLQRQMEIDKWIANNEPAASTATTKQMSKTQKMLYALMIVGTMLYFTLPDNKKK